MNLAAMVVGCLSPDFEYFIQLAPQGSFGHTWLGILAADLPLSLLVLWLYESYIKIGLHAIAPGLFPFGKNELKARPVARGLKQWVVVVLSILFGAATHLVWDSFTHKQFWPYAHIAFLRVEVPLPFLLPMPVCNILQWTSSIVGVAVLFVLWSRWIRALRRSDVPLIRRMGFVIIGTALLIAVLRAAVLTHFFGKLMLTAIAVVTFLTMFVLLAGLIGAWQRWSE